MGSDRQQERFIRELVATTVGECSECQSAFGVEDVSVLGQQDELWFFSLTCGQCRSQGVVAAQIGPEPFVPPAAEPESRTGAPTADFSGPVVADDVREMRKFLDAFDGDFVKLFHS